MKSLYIEEERPGCKIGQGEDCNLPAVAVIAVFATAPNAWSEPDQRGGVVYLCERHSQTAPIEWDSPPPFPGDS
jgi:hypothetical protein